MRTKISVQDVIRIGGCQSGIDEANALGQSVGIPIGSEVEFDVVIDTCKKTNNKFLENYFLKNKIALLEYTNKEVLFYIFQNEEYETLEEAQNKLIEYQIQRNLYHQNLTSVGFTESFGENQAWITVDIDTFIIPEGLTEYHFHVFNHKTGQYIEAVTKEEAKQIRINLINEFTLEDLSNVFIYKRSVYMEDGVSTIDEVV